MAKSVAEIRAELTAPGQLFEMEAVEIGGVPIRVWKNAPPTLRSVFDLSALHGDKPFVVYEDERLTFGEHHRAAATFAHRLIDSYGVRKGDRVAIAMRNFPEWLLAFWGAAVAGAIVVPLNAWWTGPELEYGVADSAAKVLVVDEERAQRLRPYADFGVSGVIVARAQHPLTDDEVAFDDVLGSVLADATPPDVALEPEDEATIFYTSGTTGFPKGALGTHRNICTNVMSLAFGAFYASARNAALTGDAGGPDVEAMAAGAAEQADPAVRPAVPRHRLPRHHARVDQLRWEARDHVQVGSRAGARADRARAHHDDRRRARDGVATARVAVVRERPTSRAFPPSVTAGRRRRRSSSAASRSCSPAARPRTAGG